jgi:hypothetical protein
MSNERDKDFFDVISENPVFTDSKAEFLEVLQKDPLSAIDFALNFLEIKKGHKEIKKFIEQQKELFVNLIKNNQEEDIDRFSYCNFILFEPTLDKENKVSSISEEQLLNFFKFLNLLPEETKDLSKFKKDKNYYDLNFSENYLHSFFFRIRKDNNQGTGITLRGSEEIISNEWFVELHIRQLNLPKPRLKKPETGILF